MPLPTTRTRHCSALTVRRIAWLVARPVGMNAYGKEQRDHDRDRLQRCLPLKGAEEMIYPKHAATGDAKPVDNVVQLVEGALQNLTW